MHRKLVVQAISSWVTRTNLLYQKGRTWWAQEVGYGRRGGRGRWRRRASGGDEGGGNGGE